MITWSKARTFPIDKLESFMLILEIDERSMREDPVGYNLKDPNEHWTYISNLRWIAINKTVVAAQLYQARRN